MNRLSVGSGPWSVFIYGPPGVGKSTMGRGLAEALNLPFIDLDEDIEDGVGMPIPEIFSREGESGFREWETDALFEALSAAPSVISLGGGALLSSQNRSAVEGAGQVVCLTAPLETLIQRMAGKPNSRPLLAGDREHQLRDLIAARADHYDSFELKISTDGKDQEAVLEQIQASIGHYYLRAMGDGYRVLIQEGGLEFVGELVQAQNPRGPLALVSDENVAPLYADAVLDHLNRAGLQTHLVTFPAGESHKNLSTVQELWNAFLSVNLERGGMVLALGGGVVGDMAGFAAAAYLRGVRWAALPTTLLAMVDASLGGKTGVDLPQGKNLVGAFHPPSFVLTDPSTLRTLPEDELRSGMAEVVKHGVIGDPELVKKLTGYRNWSSLVKVIRRAAGVKIDIIEQDPYEGSQRAALNLGHTVGHAVEAAFGYQLKHGEAVAIGMVTEAKLAELIGIAESGLAADIENVLSSLALPTKVPENLDTEDLIYIMKFDKKRSNRTVRFALPVRVGEVRVGIEIPELGKLAKRVFR